MNSLLYYEITVVAAAVYTLAALTLMLTRTAARVAKPTFAVSAGSESSGIAYAFFKGMLPSEKESVRKHLPTFTGGLLYHAGIFAAFVLLGLELTRTYVLGTVASVLQIVIALGLVAGLALLVKRIVLRKMRIISTPDDFITNGLVDLFLALSLMATMSQTILPLYFMVTVLLLLYVPLGKIRHCVFFFCTRTIFGRLFGRRGVLPHPAQEKGAGSR